MTIIGSLRDAVTAAGGTPTSYNKVALLRQLVTALGGTPTKRDVIGLLRQAVTAAGGTPTKYAEVYVLRELLVALGATAATFILYKLYEQLATAAAGGGTSGLTAPVLTKTSAAGAPLAFNVTFLAEYVGKYFHLQLASDAAFTTPLAGEGAVREVTQPILMADLIDGPVFDILADQPDGDIYAELRIESDEPAESAWSNEVHTTVVAPAAPAIYRSGAATNDNTTPFTGITTYTGKRHIIIIESSNTLAIPSAVSLDGNAMTKRGAGTLANTKALTVWDVVIATGGTGKSLAITMTTTGDTAYGMWTMDSSAVYGTQQVLPYNYQPDPQVTASLTVPSGGAVLIGVISEGGSNIAPDTGTTQDDEFVEAVSGFRHWYGQMAATGVPSVSGLNYAGSGMIAASYG